MAKGIIGRVPMYFDPTAPAGKQWTPDRSRRWEATELQRRLTELADGKPVAVVVQVEKLKSPRTLSQNRMMWALLTIMAEHMSGGRTGSVTPEDCYYDMLAAYGSEFYMLHASRALENHLRKSFRIVKVIELLDNNEAWFKCGMGSSVFDTKEMKDLIDGIFDRLAELGVNDPVVTDYWRETHGTY